MLFIGLFWIRCVFQRPSVVLLLGGIDRRKLRVVWMTSGNPDQSETVHMNRLSYGRIPRFMARPNKWVHCVLSITKNAAPTGDRESGC